MASRWLVLQKRKGNKTHSLVWQHYQLTALQGVGTQPRKMPCKVVVVVVVVTIIVMIVKVGGGLLAVVAVATVVAASMTEGAEAPVAAVAVHDRPRQVLSALTPTALEEPWLGVLSTVHKLWTVRTSLIRLSRACLA
jgi:uncharacterized membrane protein (UPF0182 family)